MLETVAKGFRAARNKLTGKAELTEGMIDEALRDIRVALLEADVSLQVAKSFVARVREKALGEVVVLKATDRHGRELAASPSDHFVKICHDELEALMGPVDTSLRFSEKQRPTGIMMVGLQGSGKTTTAAKLAKRLLGLGKKPLLVAADIYRPAAIEQLKILGAQLGIPVYEQPGTRPPELCARAFEEASRLKRDVVIMDTAGRLAIDEEMMAELETVKAQARPDNILLVCDAMIGQDAVRTAAEFDRRLTLDGFILTKLDGDARGGAALSIKEVTGRPIKFLGLGEGLDKLEEFRPEGLASRILGFGDIVGLMKDFEAVVDEEKAERDAAKILSGEFSFGDFVEQIRLVRKMGPLQDLLEKFPLFGEMSEGMQVSEKELGKIGAMHDSMTPEERARPEVLDESRMRRVARGSGHKAPQVKEVVARYSTMRGVMKQIGGAPGLLGSLPGFKQVAQLRKMKGMDLSELFGEDAQAMEQMLSGGAPALPLPAGLPRGMTPPMSQAALARARMMGYAPPTVAKPVSDEERRRLRDKRKRERQARKKNRKRR